ncbi:hypothetical protein, partial [Porphyromonas uenonis]
KSGLILAPSKEIAISSVKPFESPARKRKIHRNFEIFLPKFHFILPNFYFPVPWRNFVSSLEISYFLPRGGTRGEKLEIRN